VSDLVVDLSSNNPVFSFPLANSQGCRSGYIKLGGDNIARYVSGSYAARVDAAHAAGWPVGSYWLTGRHDPDQAALFFDQHLRNFGGPDYIVLDNETLDDGNTYTDAEAAEWVRAVHTHVNVAPERVVHYGSKSFMESHSWPQLLATGCSFIIADYNGTPFVNHVPSTIPADRIIGHQYADNGSIGGAHPVDLNAFTEAFIAAVTPAGGGASPITPKNGNDVFDNEAQTFLTNLADDIKSALRREARGRLYFCSAPPAGLPQFVCIFWDRDAKDGDNILYANDGETQADHWNSVYSQTADTVAQAKKAELSPGQYQTLINLALGQDTAFTNKLAAK
jgi:hypothetical protein